MRKILSVSLFTAVVIAVTVAIMISACGDDDNNNNNSIWVKATEESLLGDWVPDGGGHYSDWLGYMTFAPDGNRTGGSLYVENCYWLEWQPFTSSDPWQLKGDTLYMKYYSKNVSCLYSCYGMTGRFLVKISAGSMTLRMKWVDMILTSGDTIAFEDEDWFIYRRIDAAARKELLKNAVPMPVFYSDMSIDDGLLWVNSADNKTLDLWPADLEGFNYIERDPETGDSIVYKHHGKCDATGLIVPCQKVDEHQYDGNCDAPPWYTTHGVDGNRLVLRNATVDGSVSLGELVFEYDITTTGFLDVMKMRRIENGEPIGEFETWERVCNDSLCGDWWDDDEWGNGGLSKRALRPPYGRPSSSPRSYSPPVGRR